MSKNNIAIFRQPSTLSELYLFKNQTDGRCVKEPKAKYSSTKSQKLRDQFEDHFARYHFHHLSLLAIASNETFNGDGDWEYGASLAGRDLQQQGQELLSTWSNSDQ